MDGQRATSPAGEENRQNKSPQSPQFIIIVLFTWWPQLGFTDRYVFDR